MPALLVQAVEPGKEGGKGMYSPNGIKICLK